MAQKAGRMVDMMPGMMLGRVVGKMVLEDDKLVVVLHPSSNSNCQMK